MSESRFEKNKLSNPSGRKKKSHLKPPVGLFVLLLLFCFPPSKLQVFSQSFALTGEDQLESSLLATMWDWNGGDSRRVILYEITHLARSEFTTSCKHTVALFQI